MTPILSRFEIGVGGELEAVVHKDGAGVVDRLGVDGEAAGVHATEIQLGCGDGLGRTGDVAKEEGYRAQEAGEVENAQMVLAHKDVVGRGRENSQLFWERMRIWHVI